MPDLITDHYIVRRFVRGKEKVELDRLYLCGDGFFVSRLEHERSEDNGQQSDGNCTAYKMTHDGEYSADAVVQYDLETGECCEHDDVTCDIEYVVVFAGDELPDFSTETKTAKEALAIKWGVEQQGRDEEPEEESEEEPEEEQEEEQEESSQIPLTNQQA